jgi:hypothetical protein
MPNDVGRYSISKRTAMAFHYSEDIRDGKGNRIGSIRQIEDYGTDVYDSVGNRIGNTNQAGTFDANGNRIADRQLPGLLLPKAKAS